MSDVALHHRGTRSQGEKGEESEKEGKKEGKKVWAGAESASAGPTSPHTVNPFG